MEASWSSWLWYLSSGGLFSPCPAMLCTIWFISWAKALALPSWLAEAVPDPDDVVVVVPEEEEEGALVAVVVAAESEDVAVVVVVVVEVVAEASLLVPPMKNPGPMLGKPIVLQEEEARTTFDQRTKTKVTFFGERKSHFSHL